MNRRKVRTLDPNKPGDVQHAGTAIRAGAEYYHDDVSHDLYGDLNLIAKPELFRNVKWGACATDKSNDAEFPDHPTFQPLGYRSEVQADRQVHQQPWHQADTSQPAPRDWMNEEAISILNKRTMRQIRRNTSVRLRPTPVPFVVAERQWILENLRDRMPTTLELERLVTGLNQIFAGNIVEGASDPGPVRTVNSLRGEIWRYGSDFYFKGLVPVPRGKAKKGP